MSYRAALITGSSGGIGGAFARILPAETHLVVTGRNATRLQQLASELASPGRGIEAVAADLATAEGRSQVIEAARRSAIDLFVCNAGIGNAGNFCATPVAAERETIAVNIVATIELLHALVPLMIERARQDKRRGGIIVVSSATALKPSPGLASYGASKALQLHLSQTLAMELRGEPLDVLALCPTYTKTDFFVRAGLPAPLKAMSPEQVAREGIAALGRRSLHLCGTGPLPQALRQLLALNSALDARYWPRSFAGWIRAWREAR